jgi:hypothetical protein
MTISVKGILGCAVLFVLFGLVSGQDAKPSVDSFGWMAGCWELSVSQRSMTISEQWMKPAGGSLIGMGRTVKAGKTVSFEFLRIVGSETGVDYIAKPSSSKGETVFKLVRSTANELIFENLAHDFPQRVIYRNEKSDSLFARIEGIQNGKLNGMDIPMKRVRCD